MDEVVLGQDKVTRAAVRIARELRTRHLYVLGRSGAGKSSLFHRLIHQDAKRGHAVVLFDAGDLASAVFESLPERVLDRVLFFSLAHPIPYNPLLRRRDEPARLENELFALLDQVTAEGSSTAPLSARMKRLLSEALRTVLRQSAPTLSDLVSYLLGEKPRLATALRLRPEEFEITWEGVIDRLAPFVRDRRIRRVVCRESALDFGKVIDEGRILLVSLAGLEPPLRRFLGTLLFHGLQATVLERAREDRRPVAVYVDEFQDYVSSSYAVANFQTLFSQGRRHAISLTVAHQDFGTVDRALLHTIHGNAASLVAFSCGAEEAEAMSELFGTEYSAHTIGFLPDHEPVARIGRRVQALRTYGPLHRLREVAGEASPLAGDDPPDPFDNRHHEQRDPYREARKPRAHAA